MAAYEELPDMDSEEFKRWQSLLEQRTGVWLAENRKSFLLTNLAQRMRERGFESYQSYFDSLDNGVGSALEWASLVDLLTVHETRFFRDMASMDLVRNHIQKLINKAVNQQQEGPVNAQVWSVGCSTGEEVYSLAMLASDVDTSALQKQGRNFYFGLTGVDISFPALAQAREAIYHQRKLYSVPPEMLDTYFDSLADGYYQVRNQLRHRTCFVQANVKELESSPKQLYDVIYCQNVLIYFQNERREKIVEQFISRLSPGGLLVLGPGELNNVSHPLIEKVSTKHCQAYLRAGG
ncbi:CheR family methyltransferase [Pleionea mediterranea]|uniref:protein-glutamate O-methyltransferase n=1 Tax=Pleionea mediterranea TaxID=523701 RepID=A0A316FDB9_9GAMM|nr:protein-glutamate O-methyltransferase CheR [Pleionea mediterranea]PWK46878.1 chemotaxis protein methyltransferase CheR/type IV pilus assembly protein PilK [Pleionea mediterranea]